METNEKNLEIQLFSSVDENEINQICGILENNNIPFVKKIDGSGSYMNLYMGQSIQEKRIFINKGNYENSLELISPFITKKTSTKSTTEKDSQNEDNEIKKYILMKRSVGLLILGLPIFLFIIVLLLSIL